VAVFLFDRYGIVMSKSLLSNHPKRTACLAAACEEYTASATTLIQINHSLESFSRAAKEHATRRALLDWKYAEFVERLATIEAKQGRSIEDEEALGRLREAIDVDLPMIIRDVAERLTRCKTEIAALATRRLEIQKDVDAARRHIERMKGEVPQVPGLEPELRLADDDAFLGGAGRARKDSAEWLDGERPGEEETPPLLQATAVTRRPAKIASDSNIL
jgi:hypothetical protein